MLPKHNSDRITRRMLTWVFLIAIVGTLYIVYAPFHQADITAQERWQEEWFESSKDAHHTASDPQSLSPDAQAPLPTDYGTLEKARENEWEAAILAREKNSQVVDNAEEKQEAELGNLEQQDTVAQAVETATASAEPNQTPEKTAETAQQAPSSTAQAVENKAIESPNVSLNRGVFEKRLITIGASDNAWQSIMRRKDINPVLLRQLQGLVKRLAQPHKMVEILYSDYVRNGKSDPANSKLLAVRTPQWSYFSNEESGEIYFYDIDGNAPEPSMDRAPFAYSHVSSEFSLTRLHPITRRIRPHTGVDLKGAYGTPIASTGVGVVSFAGWQSGYGRLVIVQHPNNYETRYAHLSAIDVEVGQQVKRGQIVGKLGNSGASTGPHLHYEVRIDGVPYNPLTVKLPSYKPLRRSDLPAFRQYATLYLNTIDELKVRK